MRRIVVLAFAAVGLVLAVGCSAPTEELDGEEAEDPALSSTEEELGSCHQCSNCVDYARCRQPRLPHGLTTYGDKVARINSHTPHRGCVAVIKTSSIYGHVAYVNGVSGGRISIDEGNWPTGHCGQRSGTPSALHVSGYICP